MFEYQADALPFPRGFSAGIYYTQPTTQYVSTRASCFTPCYFRYFPKYNLSSPQPSSFASLQSWTRSNLDRYKYRFDIYIYVYIAFARNFSFFFYRQNRTNRIIEISVITHVSFLSNIYRSFFHRLITGNFP